MMKNVFYFMLKALFVAEIFILSFYFPEIFLSRFFDHEGKCLDKKARLNFKTYNITGWTANNYNTDIAKYLQKQAQPGNEIWSVNRNALLKNHGENERERLVPDLFLFFKKALYKIKASGHHFSFNIFW